MSSQPPKSPPRRTALRAAVLGLLLAGCASYPERTKSALNAFRGGHFDRAVEAYTDTGTTGSTFLSGAEAGAVALTAGQWQRASDELGRAAAFVEEVENSALVSPENLGSMLVKWTVSETLLDYHGEGYERVLLHGCRSMAYLALGKLDDARVEVRRANALLESEEELYEKKYEAGGLGHFVSALSYELEGKYDEAYIDYARMEEKGVGLPLAGSALLRLARLLHYPEVEQWEERYGPGEPVEGEDLASIVVLGGVGLGPYKREVSLTIPTGRGGLVKWAVPEFVSRAQPVARLELEVAGGSRPVRTVVIEDVDHVARRNLDDRIAWLATRSAVRAFVKYELTRQMADNSEYAGVAILVGSLFAVLTEQADLRSWQTLPSSWQAARAFVPAGTHRLALRAMGGERKELGTFQLDPGETLIVFARSVGTRLHAHPVGGKEIRTVAPPPGSEGPLATTHVNAYTETPSNRRQRR